MYKKINFLLIILLPIILLTSCKKEDIFNFDLPTGRINGKLLYEVGSQPAKDIVVILKNTNSGGLHLTITDAKGNFTVGRLSAGKYSVVPTNDSLYSPLDVFADVDGGAVVNVPDIKIKLTDLPVLTLDQVIGVQEVTNSSMTLRTLVNDGHSTITSRGYSYLKSSDPRDASEGTKKAHSISLNPFDLTFYEFPVTGLTSNTEYKIKAYVRLPRGGFNDNGGKKHVLVYSDNTIYVKTLP